MAACDIDFSALPILTGCPGDTELFLVGNAVGGLDSSGNYTVGYGRRYWGDMRKCILAGLVFVKNQFTVGFGGMTAGSTVLVINTANILQDSIWISLDGTELPYNDPTRISYTTDYSNPTRVTITFNQGVSNLQEYIVHYCYAPQGIGPVPIPTTNEGSGKSTQNGDGITTQFIIPHGLTGAPSYINVNVGTSDGEGSYYITADGTNIYINYSIAPPNGVGNLIFYWQAKI
jgi:hypothetical protein